MAGMCERKVWAENFSHTYYCSSSRIAYASHNDNVWKISKRQIEKVPRSSGAWIMKMFCSRRVGACSREPREEFKLKINNRWHTFVLSFSQLPHEAPNRLLKCANKEVYPIKAGEAVFWFLPRVGGLDRLCWLPDTLPVHFESVGFLPATSRHNESFLCPWCCRRWAQRLPIESGPLGIRLHRRLTRRWFRHRASRSPKWRFVYKAGLCWICTRQWIVASSSERSMLQLKEAKKRY